MARAVIFLVARGVMRRGLVWQRVLRVACLANPSSLTHRQPKAIGECVDPRGISPSENLAWPADDIMDDRAPSPSVAQEIRRIPA